MGAIIASLAACAHRKRVLRFCNNVIATFSIRLSFLFASVYFPTVPLLSSIWSLRQKGSSPASAHQCDTGRIHLGTCTVKLSTATTGVTKTEGMHLLVCKCMPVNDCVQFFLVTSFFECF